MDRHPALELALAERADYLVIVASLAAADGQTSDAEMARLREWCTALDLPAADRARVVAAAEAPNATEVGKALIRLHDSPLRFTLVTDLVFLALVDGTYGDEEQREIHRIAGLCGVSVAQVGAIERYARAVHEAGKTTHLSGKELKRLGGDVAAGLASAGVPIAAVAVSGSVFGLSAAGISSGLAALGLGLGMASGIGVAAAIGVGSYFGVRWLYRKVVED